jgi:hypothetical protein
VLSALAALVFAVIAAIRIVSTYPIVSTTWDEPSSVSCGMQWLDLGIYQYDAKHPPLGRVATALGLYLHGIRSAGKAEQYEEGNRLLRAGGRYKSNLALARAGVLPFFFCACMVVWAWTWWAFGPLAGGIAVLLFSSTPPVMAHAGIAMTDTVLVATLPAALLCFCLWIGHPTALRSTLLGAIVGLALLSQFTTFLFFGFSAIPLLISYRLCCGLRVDSIPGLKVARNMALATVVTGLVIWAGYRFSYAPAIDVQLPAGEFVKGLQELWIHNGAGHPNYFLGERSMSGWWSFYPVLLLVKTPIPFLILLLTGLFMFVHDPTVRRNWRAWTLVLSATGMLLVGFTSYVNTGLRHMLPIYVMMAGIAGFGAFRLLDRGWIWRGVSVGLLTWHLVASDAAHPDYLAYFNTLAAPAGEAGFFGVDSDLDWGQDLWRLRDACAQRRVDNLWIAYNGSADLNQFELPQWRKLPPSLPQTGWIAISIYKLKLGSAIEGSLEGADSYSWLEMYQPVAFVGKSMRLYYIPKS